LLNWRQEGDEIISDDGEDENFDDGNADADAVDNDLFGGYDEEEEDEVEEVLELNPHPLFRADKNLSDKNLTDKSSKLVSTESPVQSSLDPDIVLLSDSWFSNFSSVPTNAPKTVEFYVDNGETETIDLTMNEDEKADKKADKKGRQPKTIQDEDLVSIL
jgi:hypothetical protein